MVLQDLHYVEIFSVDSKKQMKDLLLNVLDKICHSDAQQSSSLITTISDILIEHKKKVPTWLLYKLFVCSRPDDAVTGESILVETVLV